MRTFILRARKGTTRWDRVCSQIGNEAHFEVIAHSVINAFFISNGFREDVEVYIILDSSEDFPRTLRLEGGEGLSIPGFHEKAILQLVESALKKGYGLQKDETRLVAPGISISGFGFDKLAKLLLETRPTYWLSPKGDNIENVTIGQDPVFILSDHLAMPSKSIKSLARKGMKALSLGKKMLFASQCVVLIHHALDK